MSEETPYSQEFPDPTEALLALTNEISDTKNALRETNEAIKVIPTIDRYTKRSRRMITALAICFSLDIILTLIVAIVGLTAHSTASTLRTDQINECYSGNTTRVQEAGIWTTFIDILVPPVKPANVTEAQYTADKATAATFLKTVDKDFAPRDCVAIYSVAGS
jgi:hypothetical protein